MQEVETTQIEWLILADAAEVVNKKLYLMGGGWDKLIVNELPYNLTMAAALSILVPWTEANIIRSFAIEIQTADADRIAKMPGQFEVGRPPGARQGQPLRVQVALGVHLELTGLGTYVVIASVDGGEDQRFSFNVVAGPDLVIQQAS